MVKLNLQLFAKKVTDSIVNDVIRGKYGNGDARKTALSNADYDYKEVQAAVNAKLKGGTSNTPSTPQTKPANTQTNTPATTFNLNGVSQTTQDKINNNLEFKTKDSTDELKKNSDDRTNKFYELADKDNIVDQKYLDILDKQWNGGSETIQQADALIKSQLEWMNNGGKTEFTDKYYAAMDKYLDREDFVYDVDNDPLFQQALASAMNSGQTAMQDTIGQASALTGGYGSTYATSAGNQAYNAFIEDAYNNLPQYYQMALSAYEAEGQDLYNQVMMLGSADSTAYGKKMDALNTTMDWRNQQYQEEYNAFRDTKTDANNMANLQLGIYGTQLDAAYKGADLAANQWQQAYTNDLNEWNANISNLFAMAGYEQTEYWNDKNYTLTEYWNDKNYKLEESKVSNDNRVAELEAENQALEDKYAGYLSPEMQKAASSERTKRFESSIMTYRDFIRRGSSNTVGGKETPFDNYNQYIEAIMEKWYKEGKLTENEVAYLKGYYGIE